MQLKVRSKNSLQVMIELYRICYQAIIKKCSRNVSIFKYLFQLAPSYQYADENREKKSLAFMKSISVLLRRSPWHKKSSVFPQVSQAISQHVKLANGGQCLIPFSHFPDLQFLPDAAEVLKLFSPRMQRPRFCQGPFLELTWTPGNGLSHVLCVYFFIKELEKPQPKEC